MYEETNPAEATDVQVRARHEALHAVILMAHKLPCDSLDIAVDDTEGTGGLAAWRALTLDSKQHPTTEVANRLMEFVTVAVAPHVGNQGHDADLELSCSADLVDAAEFAGEILALETAPSGYHGELTVEGLIEYAHALVKPWLDTLAQDVDYLATLLVKSSGEYALGRSDLNPVTGKVAMHLLDAGLRQGHLIAPR